jgi:hypothetical protein
MVAPVIEELQQCCAGVVAADPALHGIRYYQPSLHCGEFKSAPGARNRLRRCCDPTAAVLRRLSAASSCRDRPGTVWA